MVSQDRSSVLIVVPTLNSYQLLPRLLSSLQHQSWTNWRLLFIDGPSRPEHRNWLLRCCLAEPRCRWVIQNLDQPGIFGAMNQGFAFAAPNDWLLFWGSDDWAATPYVLSSLLSTIQSSRSSYDLIVCQGRYVKAETLTLGRPTTFPVADLLTASRFRLALFLGSTPPHQATLFGPGARSKLGFYSSCFNLSADLDYFLQLSRNPNLRVQSLDLELVHISDGGVSGHHTKRRLEEVFRAYTRAYGWYWWIPFFLRYVRRLLSLVSSLP